MAEAGKDGIDLGSDVTALREALAAQSDAARREQERLTFELGHRVKNTLSVVQALANQTFRGTASVPDALAAFGERIAALSRANDVILNESWTTATLGAVAAGVLEPQGAPVGPVVIAGPMVRVGASAALSFAMALHELATNAKRFGAWSEPEGGVELAWAMADGKGGDHLDLRWTEIGGPMAADPTSRGFGLRFAEQSLRSAFGRDVVFEFKPTGFECRVRAPQDALTA